MSGTFPWYVARAAGIVSWLLLAASVLWGLALSTRALGDRPRPNWLLDLHRGLGGTALAFTGVHVLALLADRYVRFTPVALLVPFAASWHPVALAWGIVSLYLLLAVELTSLARHRLSKRSWRRIHTASFVLFVTATIHGLAAGTDTRSPATRMLVLAVAVLVAGLVAVRVIDLVRLPAVAPTPVGTRRDLPARR